ncbi:hypothetical protein BpHYR1_001461 [Brachionus plicatilis]|uniref:Uncharacterized protein n=1 Tax=Brachionus plicatilis TaxID=10195 RepID=A0A3M7P202_BRAPC|nr:hypothetical protein BpHYR1_001461 [Brachionus plicatilis]
MTLIFVLNLKKNYINIQSLSFRLSICYDLVDLKIKINLSAFKCLTLGNIDSFVLQILLAQPNLKFFIMNFMKLH